MFPSSHASRCSSAVPSPRSLVPEFDLRKPWALARRVDLPAAAAAECREVARRQEPERRESGRRELVPVRRLAWAWQLDCLPARSAVRLREPCLAALLAVEFRIPRKPACLTGPL